MRPQSPNSYQQALVAKAREIAQARLAARADHHDREMVFPKESLQDLSEAGLTASLVDKAFGGLGLGHHRGDILTHWLIVKEIAKADMALARCFEGHANAMLLIDCIADDAQKARWFEGVVNHGHNWAVWSGEPQVVKPGQKQRFGTYVKETTDGYYVDGSKVFCSSAPGADWAILMVSTKGPGGARHATSAQDLIMLACDLRDPSVTVDDSWWDPMGMKGSVSYLVRFEETFIPKENLIGTPGQYLHEDWQTRFTPQYTATFLGGAEAAYEYALAYIQKQQSQQDPYVQHRIGKMAIHLETCRMWLARTAHLWETGEIQEAKLAGNSTRYLVEQLTMEVVNHAIHICGARSLIRPSALERIYRDLSFYVRHDNDDQVLAMVGKANLGVAHDASFFHAGKEDRSARGRASL